MIRCHYLTPISPQDVVGEVAEPSSPIGLDSLLQRAHTGLTRAHVETKTY